MNQNIPTNDPNQPTDDLFRFDPDPLGSDFELSLATESEAIEMLERAGNVSTLRSQIEGNVHVPTSQLISDTIGHMVDAGRIAEPTILPRSDLSGLEPPP